VIIECNNVTIFTAAIRVGFDTADVITTKVENDTDNTIRVCATVLEPDSIPEDGSARDILLNINPVNGSAQG